MENNKYNEPTMENIFRTLKNIESKVCPWIECKCGKKMRDVGYSDCFTCKKGGAPTIDTPAPKMNIDDLIDF